VTLLVDTSVWSLLLRRHAPSGSPHTLALREALQAGERVATTGIILQELLQGGVPARTRKQIAERFAALEYVDATREDHIAAAELSNALRSAGVQVGTVDALIAQLAIGNDMTLLTTDHDFEHVAEHAPLRLWAATRGPSG
jgi:predicted nucleic acid-binding protein